MKSSVSESSLWLIRVCSAWKNTFWDNSRIKLQLIGFSAGLVCWWDSTVCTRQLNSSSFQVDLPLASTHKLRMYQNTSWLGDSRHVHPQTYWWFEIETHFFKKLPSGEIPGRQSEFALGLYCPSTSSYPPTKTAFCTDSKSLSKHSNFKSSIYKRVLHLVSIIFLAVSWGRCTTSQYFPRSPNLLSSAGWWESHLNLCLDGNPKGISHLPILVVQPVSCRKAES